MPVQLTGPPQEAAAQLIAHLQAKGILGEAGNRKHEAAEKTAPREKDAAAQGNRKLLG